MWGCITQFTAQAIAPKYPFEMPTTLAALGYSTTSIGKDHFGWVDPTYGRSACDAPSELLQHNTNTNSDRGDGAKVDFPPDAGHGIPHGYAQTELYDGIVSEMDDYHQWFQRAMYVCLD